MLASRIAPSVDALTMTAYQFLAGMILSLPLVLAQASHAGTFLPEAATPGNWLAAIAAGILGLALAFLLYNYAAGHVSATTAGMSLTLIPLFGLLGAVVLLGERLDTGRSSAASSSWPDSALRPRPAPGSARRIDQRRPAPPTRSP